MNAVPSNRTTGVCRLYKVDEQKTLEWRYMPRLPCKIAVIGLEVKNVVEKQE
jgi:hypothetical protein